MPDALPSPFAALSLIVAPAILTNASSVLAMSTSNRLARAVDRARELARQIEAEPRPEERAVRQLRELVINEDRAVLLLRALRSFYSAMGAFALATLLSLIGSVAAAGAVSTAVRALEIVAVAAGVVAVGALVHGAILLFRETGLAVGMLRERVDSVRQHRGHLPRRSA
jgi:hypothetical protein